jgi:hypothetical protein
MKERKQGRGSKEVSKRMSLVEGLHRDRELLDPVVVENFVKRGTAEAGTEIQPEPQTEPTDAAPQPIALQEKRTDKTSHGSQPSRAPKPAAVITPGLIPVNVRVRPEIAAALQTASLERQLQGIEPSSKREIVEEALEPWLRANGYLT